MHAHEETANEELLSENSIYKRSMTESDLKKSSSELVDLSKVDVVISVSQTSPWTFHAMALAPWPFLSLL